MTRQAKLEELEVALQAAHVEARKVFDATWDDARKVYSAGIRALDKEEQSDGMPKL